MQLKKKQLIQDSIIYTVLPKISFVASIFITPFISKNLSLTDFGIYGLIVSFISIFQTLIIIGQNVVMVNSFFELKANYKLIWKRSFGLMIILGVLSSIIFCIVSYFFLAAELKTNLFIVLILVSTSLILSPIDILAVNYYVLHQKSYPYAIATAISGLFIQATILYTIKYLKLGYVGWIVGMPIGYIVLYILYSKELFFKEKLVPVFRLKRSFLKKAIKIGLPMVPHQLSLYILGTSDRILLNMFNIKVSQIGVYNQGYTLGSSGGLLVNGIFQALSRFFQEGLRSDDQNVKTRLSKLMKILPLLISILLGIVSLWMKEIYQVLYKNPELQSGYPIATIIICSYMYWAIYSLFSISLVIQKKTAVIARISLTAAIFNLIANVILIPYLGVWSAIITTYIGYMIFGLAGVFIQDSRTFLERYFNVKKLIFVSIALNLLLLISTYMAKDIHYGYKIALSILLLIGFYSLLRRVTDIKLTKIFWWKKL